MIKQEDTLRETATRLRQQEMGLFTEMEVAQALGISTGTLQTWRQNRTGPAYTKLGKFVFYRREDLQMWIQAQVVDNAPSKTAA
jgi:predicted DNA-binding transcriptional regulator AlpA